MEVFWCMGNDPMAFWRYPWSHMLVFRHKREMLEPKREQIWLFTLAARSFTLVIRILFVIHVILEARKSTLGNVHSCLVSL